MTRCLCFLPVDEWVDISKSQRLSQCLLCTLAIGPNQYAWSHLHPEMENPCGGWWISLVCTDPLTSRLLHEREREKEGKKGGTGERERGGGERDWFTFLFFKPWYFWVSLYGCFGFTLTKDTLHIWYFYRFSYTSKCNYCN